MIYATDSLYYHSFLRNSGVYRDYSSDEDGESAKFFIRRDSSRSSAKDIDGTSVSVPGRRRPLR